jgi:hypothetical protein
MKKIISIFISYFLLNVLFLTLPDVMAKEDIDIDLHSLGDAKITINLSVSGKAGSYRVKWVGEDLYFVEKNFRTLIFPSKGSISVSGNLELQCRLWIDAAMYTDTTSTYRIKPKTSTFSLSEAAVKDFIAKSYTETPVKIDIFLKEAKYSLTARTSKPGAREKKILKWRDQNYAYFDYLPFKTLNKTKEISYSCDLATDATCKKGHHKFKEETSQSEKVFVAGTIIGREPQSRSTAVPGFCEQGVSFSAFDPEERILEVVDLKDLELQGSFTTTVELRSSQQVEITDFDPKRRLQGGVDSYTGTVEWSIESGERADDDCSELQIDSEIIRWLNSHTHLLGESTIHWIEKTTKQPPLSAFTERPLIPLDEHGLDSHRLTDWLKTHKHYTKSIIITGRAMTPPPELEIEHCKIKNLNELQYWLDNHKHLFENAPGASEKPVIKSPQN